MPRKPKVTRRGKNEGSVYRRKDGKWVGQVTVGYRPDNGKPIRKYTYANTREEAARWVALTLTTELDKETHRLSEDLILKDFLHKWLTTFKVHEVCSRTMELYYSSERLHIVPALGNCALDAVTPLKVQTFLYQLQSEKQLSNRTISLIRSVLIQKGLDLQRCHRIQGAVAQGRNDVQPLAGIIQFHGSAAYLMHLEGCEPLVEKVLQD